MLKILSCERPEYKQNMFADFNGRTGAWIVSDLQSKWHLQKELLARQGVLEQAGVWRAAELWRHFAFQLRPDMRLLSPELAQTLFWTWIEPLNLPWAKSPQAVPVLLEQMQLWMSVFSDPRFNEIMPEWFAANPESYVKWGHWFELCGEIWRRCQEERLIMVNWLPAVLLSHDLSTLHWSREMTFDLGPQISPVEGQLIKELARHFDVNLIYPEAPWIGLMKNTLRPYDDLLDQPFRGDPDWQPSVYKQIEFGRFSTQLAEIKDAIARVREWVEQGVPTTSIALVAPDIEAYWPALELYLAEEGVPVSKSLTARLGGYLEMARWVSTLRTGLRQVSAGDLEVFLFTQQEEPRLSCDEFRVLFTHVYDAYDLRRAEHLFKSAIEPLGADPLPLSDFLIWGLKFWSATAETARLRQLLQVVGQEVPVEVKLSPRDWLSYIEGLLARRELNLRAGDETGIWCVSLSSADWLPVTHGIFLNLSEGALRRVETSPVSAFEASKLLTDTGYAVGVGDHQEHEFELLWFLNRHWTELRLTFAGTDFEGRVLTPAKLWMWAAFVNDQLKHTSEAPRLTRWDEVQHQTLAAMGKSRAWTSARAADLETSLARDVSTAVSSWKPLEKVRISVSGLESYRDCPFIFASERVLRLSDNPALDLDLDYRTRGTLLHALAERLSVEPLRYDMSEPELEALVEQVREDIDVRAGDMRLWPAQRARHVSLARAFLDFESEWRARFPHTSTIGREVAFSCTWDMLTEMPSSADGAVVLSGRLDRVDQDQDGRYALIDYKASGNATRNWGSWVRNEEYQMALYALLLENGLVGLPAGPVVAANYYVIKDSDRRKGFHVPDSSSTLYSSDDKHLNFLKPADKQKLFDDLRRRVSEAVRAIMAGQLNPHPRQESLCDGCSWRKLCRAPHLN